MNAKELFFIRARYNQENNKTIYSLLSKLSNDEREKERGSYFGSISSLFRHVLGATGYFLSLFKETLAGNAAAKSAFAAVEGLMVPEDKLDEARWKALADLRDKLDAALVNMVSALTEEDLQLPVNIPWYDGNPASTPLYFMLEQLHAHNTHHRGQISQILDELKIDNDYSGINLAFLGK